MSPESAGQLISPRFRELSEICDQWMVGIQLYWHHKVAEIKQPCI